MSAVKSTVLTLSVTLCFLGVVMLLSPKGNINKSFKSFVSICIVTVLIISILGVSSELQYIDFSEVGNIDTTVDTALNETFIAQQQSAVETAVKKLIGDGLNERGITGFQITVNSDISEDNCIYITDVTVICAEGQSLKCQEVLDSLSIKGRVEESYINGNKG